MGMITSEQNVVLGLDQGIWYYIGRSKRLKWILPTVMTSLREGGAIWNATGQFEPTLLPVRQVQVPCSEGLCESGNPASPCEQNLRRAT